MDSKYRTAKLLAELLDKRFQLGPIKIGLDPLLGLIPEIGDVIAAALAFYIVYLAREMGVPGKKLEKMIGNIIADLLIGAVPIVGDVADFAFKSNLMNWKIIEEHFKDKNEAMEGEIAN